MWWGKTFSPICYTFEVFVVWHVVRHCRGEELGHFCGPVPAASLAVLVHLIELLSILLRCNGFFRIQKVVMDQNGSRLPNSDHDLFFGANLAFGSALELLLSPATELVITSYGIKSILSYITIRSRNVLLLLYRKREEDTSKWHFPWFVDNSWGTHLSSFFTFPICVKCWVTIEWLVDDGFFGNFSWSCKRISFDDPAIWLLSNFQWLATALSSSRLLSPLLNFLNHHRTIHLLEIPGPNALLMLSCLCCFTTHFELE